MDVRLGDGTILTMSPGFNVGDPAPSGYLDWIDWAETQQKGRLRQRECSRCSRWFYPQQQAFIDTLCTLHTARGKPVEQRLMMCLECAAPAQKDPSP